MTLTLALHAAAIDDELLRRLRMRAYVRRPKCRDCFAGLTSRKQHRCDPCNRQHRLAYFKAYRTADF